MIMDRRLIYLDDVGAVDCNTLAADILDTGELHALDIRAQDGRVQVLVFASVPWRHWAALLRTAVVRAPDTIGDLA